MPAFVNGGRQNEIKERTLLKIFLKLEGKVHHAFNIWKNCFNALVLQDAAEAQKKTKHLIFLQG